jgi:hypothetical protein
MRPGSPLWPTRLFISMGIPLAMPCRLPIGYRITEYTSMARSYSMPQHELPTVVFEPFPHGRPKEYQPGYQADQLLTWPDAPPIRLRPVAPGQAVTPPPTVARGIAPVRKRKPFERPNIPLDPAVVRAALDECNGSSEAVPITTLANRIARLFSNRTWQEVESRKVAMFKQLGQMIRAGLLDRVARRYVTVPRKMPYSDRQQVI